MKFTLSWLKDHLDTQASLGEITDTLTAIGLEVEGVENPAAKFAAFKVAYVESAEKHPDADRLRVCKVNTGQEIVQVVCGAPNARTGMKGIFAPSDTYIPGTDMFLKKGVIRGQESNGMLVSEREMGLSDDHDGIIDLPDDTEVGTPFAEIFNLDDPVIEIGLTPNRADCAGIRGIARDLAAAGLGTLKDLPKVTYETGFKSPIMVELKFDADSTDACPLFAGCMIKKVKNGPSPDWMQNRLKAIGLRPISALVDITNYFSYDLCRPLHVFDADKLSGNIHVRLSKDGEELEALNDKTYKLNKAMTAVCDDDGVVAIGGVMGGTPTGCTEETTNVFVECAYFDAMRTARTGRDLQIDSDARYRFERGVDPAFVVPAVPLAVQMILDMCGGEPSEVVQAGSEPEWKRTIAYKPELVKQKTGLDIDAEQQKDILENLGFEVSKDFTVTPPSWRGDIDEDGRADIVEEVARINGFDKIPAVSLPKLNNVTMPAETSVQTGMRKARNALAGRGMDECVTWSFMDEAVAKDFSANDNLDGLKLLNPISSELDTMRPSALPNLIQAAQANHDKGYANNALFEVGPVFYSSKPDGQPVVVSGLRSDANGSRHWASGEANRAVDIYDVKADALAVLAACGAPAENAQVSRDAPDYYHPGRSGVLRLRPNVLAQFGEIHPGILDDMDVKGPVVGFEVFLENIPQPKKKPGTARALLQLSPFQPVKRDFAFVVSKDIEADQIIRAVKGADKNLISDVGIFDVYTGSNVSDNEKSIAISVTIQPRENTLTEKEIESISSKIIDLVTSKTGAVLRG